jgi:hypothetical protein
MTKEFKDNVPMESGEFDKDLDIVSEKVLMLLRGNPDKAFSLEDLISSINAWPHASVWDAINFLKKEGLLKKRRIKGNYYYSAKRSYIRHS